MMMNKNMFECPHCGRKLDRVNTAGKYFSCRHCVEYWTFDELAQLRMERLMESLNESVRFFGSWLSDIVEEFDYLEDLKDEKEVE